MPSTLTFGNPTLFRPDDPLAPRGEVFAEQWQAETLAMADAMIRAGHFTAADWATALGAALAQAETDGAPDTEHTYYTAALTALETLAPVPEPELTRRKSDWADAYRRTPHGQPVQLRPAPPDD